MMRLGVLAVFMVCTSCQGPAIGSSDDGKVLTLSNEIYGRDQYRIVHSNGPESSTRVVRVLKNGTQAAVTPLPAVDDDVKNFSLTGLEETERGFKMIVDWGGGNDLYTMVFYFVFRDGTFYLERTVSNRFHQPTEREFKSDEEITPAIPVDEFEMVRFL